MSFDDDRIQALFDAEFDAMVALARVISNSAADVEDIVMDAFVATANRSDEIENLAGYLRTAVVNGARRGYRDTTNRTRIRNRFRATLVADPVDARSDHYLDDLLAELPEREHTAIVLIYYLKETYDEAGHLMGCPSGTVKSLVHRALKRLRAGVPA